MSLAFMIKAHSSQDCRRIRILSIDFDFFGYWLLALAKNCRTLFTTSLFISALIFKVQNYLSKNSWLYEDKIQSCKVKQNQFGSCTFFPTTLLKTAVYPVHDFRRHVAVKVKFTAPLLLACFFFSFSFVSFFLSFSLTICLFSLYTNRLQILHKHCFNFS